MTVLGPVEPEELGHTHTHEHLLSDLSAILTRHGLQPVDPSDETDMTRVGPDEFPASVRRRIAEPIRLDNYDWIRRHVLNWDNLRLQDEQEAIEELGHYRTAGGGAVVESSPIGMGRDPLGLARIARATGVRVIMGAGYYVRDYQPLGLAELSEDELFERIAKEFTNGVGDTGIRPGIIGEIGLSSPVHPVEERVLRAAARVQGATGAPLQIHPGRESTAPLEAIRTIEAAGGDPARTVMAHIDRTLFAVDDMVELASTGCYLEFDLFGQESSYYAFAPIDRPNDAGRIDALQALTEAGHGDKLVIAQDICQKVYLRKYGGPGYAHILENVLPVMRRKGMTDERIRAITVENPARLLTWTSPS